MKRAHRIWRKALTVLIRRHGSKASETLLALWEREVLEIEAERRQAERTNAGTHQRGPRREPPGGYSQTATAIAKRAQRADPGRWLREQRAAEKRRRAAGALSREERQALVRQRSEETREARKAAAREERKAKRDREADRARSRARRAAMSLEERRAEWLRHQHTRRARLRAERQQEAA